MLIWADHTERTYSSSALRRARDSDTYGAIAGIWEFDVVSVRISFQ
jgi:hypothetical protein